jgi:hypothetical protein
MGNVLLSDGPGAGEGQRQLENMLSEAPIPDGVRLTCIYSREDAVVHWKACFDGDPRTRSFEVRGTHCGLAWNHRVYEHVARQLLAA